MKLILLLTAFLATGFVTIFFFVSLLRKKNLSAVKFMAAALRENQGPLRWLALGFYLWTILFLIALGCLLFVAIMCVFYTIGLIHGEIYLLLDALEPTAGTIAVHLVYPMEIFLFGIFTFVLFFGSIQIFLGPIQPLSKLALKIDGIGNLCRKLIALLAVILLLELTKTATYALLVAPELLERFFAGGVEPLMHPGAMAVLVGASVACCGVVGRVLRRRDFDER